MTNRNRLAERFSIFANKFNFKSKVEDDNLSAELHLDNGGKVIYVFDPSEDSYEFGYSVRRVNRDERPTLDSKIMSSEPIRGITERIAKGKLLVFGSREGLLHSPDEALDLFYRQDVSKLSEADQRYKKK